jgi:hypothetical protein
MLISGGEMHKLFLLIFFLCSQVYARIVPTPQDQCTYIDLRNDSLSNVRNQKKISWCYAFSGADLLNFYLNGSSKFSAADIAITYNQTKAGKFIRWVDLNIISRNNPHVRQSAHQTGFTKIALKSALRKGVCPEEFFPSESWQKVIKTPQGEVIEEINLDQAMLDIARLHSTKETLTLNNLPYYFKFKTIDQKQFLNVVKAKTLGELYSKLANQACANNRQSIEIPEKIKMTLRHPRIFRNISENLEKSNVVALDYDSRVLKDKNSKGVKISELHTSLIVGKRWNQSSKSCEFLIRNSWGEDCSHYDSRYQCEEGHIWVQERALYGSLTSIVFIDTVR